MLRRTTFGACIVTALCEYIASGTQQAPRTMLSTSYARTRKAAEVVSISMDTIAGLAPRYHDQHSLQVR